MPSLPPAHAYTLSAIVAILEGGRLCAKLNTVAKWSGLTRSTTKRALFALRASGLIEYQGKSPDAVITLPCASRGASTDRPDE